MDIKYHGIEGARIYNAFKKPETYIDMILENENRVLEDYYILFADYDIARIHPYQNGVVYEVEHQAHPAGYSKYDEKTNGQIIVGPEGISFIIDHIDGSYNDLKDEKIMEQLTKNTALEKELTAKLGSAISCDKVGYYKKSDNRLMRALEAREEKKQRAAYVAAVSKSLEVLKRAREQAKSKEETKEVKKVIEVENKTEGQWLGELDKRGIHR